MQTFPDHNTQQVKHLLRVIDTLKDFELIICGYRSLTVFREISEFFLSNCKENKIPVIPIDLAKLKKSTPFDLFLQTYENKEKGYRAYDIRGVEHHVKHGEVSSFLNHLNLLRDRLAADFPYAFFFWVPENLVKRFALDAPDLWAWRNTVLVFEEEKTDREFEGIPIRLSDSLEEYRNFTQKEKLRQAEYLEDTIASLLEKPQSPKRDQTLARVYDDLGKLYYFLGDMDEALDAMKKSLEISREIGDKAEEGRVLNNASQVFHALGDYDRALSYLEKSLEISREIGDKAEEGTIQNNFGEIYYARRDYDKALAYLKKSLKMSRKVGDKEGKFTTLNNISLIFQARGDYGTALSYLKKSLEISREIGYKVGEETTLNNIGKIYHLRGDDDKALSYLEKSLEISREIGYKAGEGATMNNFGQIFHARGDYDTALAYLEKSLEISRKIADKREICYTLHNLARITLEKNDNKKFLEYETEAYHLALEIEEAQSIYVIGSYLGYGLCKMGKKKEGLPKLERSLQIGKKANFPDLDQLEQMIEECKKGNNKKNLSPKKKKRKEKGK